MSIIKSGRTISSLSEWEKYAGPKSPDQWVDGRSAKETARAWLQEDGSHLPIEIDNALSNNPHFGTAQSWEAEPEAKLKFDGFRGEPRNSDLAVYIKDQNGEYLLTVEAKADEEFDVLLAKKLQTAEKAIQKNSRSNRVKRIEQLKEAILGIKSDDTHLDEKIRYQLLTACAGTLCEAERKGYSKALMLIQEFVSDETEDIKHRQNEADLNVFVNHISQGRVPAIKAGQIYGPFRVNGVPILKTGIDLFICKVSRNIRKTVVKAAQVSEYDFHI